MHRYLAHAAARPTPMPLSSEDSAFVLDVIYLHGLGDCPEPSRPFLGHLVDRVGTDRMSIESPDLRTLGEPAGPDTTLEAAAEAVTSRLGNPDDPRDGEYRRPTLVIGHSVGAQIGVALAPHLPSLRGIVAVEGAFFSSVASPFRRYAPDEPDGRGRERLIADLEALDAPTAREVAYLRAVRDTDGRLFDALARELVDRWEWARTQFEQLGVSRLYVAGATSVGDESLEWASSLGSSSLEATIVEEVGHSPHCERPARVAEICMHWGAQNDVWGA